MKEKETMLQKFVSNQSINLEKDYSYLDSLAGEVYVYIYDIVIHKYESKVRKEILSEEISRLNDEEFDYIKKWVKNAFDQLTQKKRKI